MSAICARLTNKGKVGVSRGKGNRRCPFLFVPAADAAVSPRPRSAISSECQRKPPPVRVNRLRGSKYPAQPVQQKVLPEKANTLTQFACPAKPVQKTARYPMKSSTRSAALCIARACLTLCAACLAFRRIDGLSIAPAATIETTAPAIAPVAIPETKGEIRIKDLPPFIKFIESVCPLVPQILHSKKCLFGTIDYLQSHVHII